MCTGGADDFSKYRASRTAGASAEAVWREAADDGLDTITRIPLVRVVFDLDLAEAKAVMVEVEGQMSPREVIAAVDMLLTQEEV